MAIVARSRPVAAGGWAGELSLQPTPRTEAVGRGGVPEGRWPSATGPPGAAELHPLGDLAGLYKLRVGDYRIIYEVLWDEETIVIHAVGHRREIYRRR
jgi:hypothetical protein